MNEWKHIGLEYPPYNKPILVTGGGIIGIAVFKLMDGLRCWQSCCNRMSKGITYWMLLPEIP